MRTMELEQLLMKITMLGSQRSSWRTLLILLISVNFLAILVMWFSLDRRCPSDPFVEVVAPPMKIDKAILFQRAFDLPNQMITVIFREFEPYEHDLEETLLSFGSVFSRMRMLVVSDSALYPPVDRLPAMAECVRLEKYLSDTPNATVSARIKTDYVLLSPDNVRLTQPAVLTELVKLLINQPDRMAAVPVGEGREVKCLSLDVNSREWTATFRSREQAIASPSLCDAISGEHVLLMPSALLFSLPFPLERPLFDAIYVQTAQRGIRVQLIADLRVTKPVRGLFRTKHLEEKRARYEEYRRRVMFNKFGIKKVMRDGVIEWFGCHKNTERCFGTVVHDTPDYLFKGRWTPPCCLENLRVTARHVFSVLEAANVRYWLEGGSLLGAARNGDIIPWDYDVDIGIYEEDIAKCSWLKQAATGVLTANRNSAVGPGVVDSKGFVWERAPEGNFLRVQFSRTNRVHVDIFPFRSNAGTMTKDTWFETHRQDREFPEGFLKPLTRVRFVGTYASAPNNVTRFLEFKFGKGVIDSPEYPNPDILAYVKKT
ncbi:fukutin-related protein-like [Tropilaelaps mercedesae]|uniref:Fukutin-related protein-like n=1 Tax=Tropilaelaps mercedesae TaxID=418985 RepID=A0A1V9XFD2_9ACAR|nr:fukutin-related protein-like [Tropilaelaps mercedesae]